jgi:hypothetical protein
LRLALGFTARIDGHNALALLLPLHQHGTTVGSSDNLSQLGQSSIALCFHESILNPYLSIASAARSLSIRSRKAAVAAGAGQWTAFGSASTPPAVSGS